ncbi:MAG: GGDEF domain-containing protein [Planctomycetaceae bacterium]
MSQTEQQATVGTTSARLIASPVSTLDVPAVFHRDTPLKQVAEGLSGQSYVLATDDNGRIAGLATAEIIPGRVDSLNEFERTRWQEMPLASLASVVFCEGTDRPEASISSGVDCVAITENDRLFGISVDGDVFLSWQRIESLLSIAFCDPLTSLPNRLAYERRLQEEWNRAERTRTSVAVIVIDLDNFKTVNDSYGHQAGDLVLTTVAHRLEACMRSYDLVARLGGDEFVSLCLGCLPGMLTVPIQRLQKSLTGIRLQIDGYPIRTTASIGAAIRHDGFDGSSPADLFAAADECLYRAKESPETAWMVELGGNSDGIPQRVVEQSWELCPEEPRRSGRRTSEDVLAVPELTVNANES